MPSPHSYHRVYYHFITHTKYRLPRLVGPLRELVWDTLQRKATEFDISPIAMNGSETHFHLLFRAKPTCNVTGFIGATKGTASFLINRELTPTPKFGWQPGYILFTVSYGHLERVRGYIRKQAKHHGCAKPLSARYSARDLRPWAGEDPVALYSEANSDGRRRAA